MNAPTRIPTPVRHVVKGRLIEGADLEYGPAHARFSTPALNLDELIWSRQEAPPAADVPVDEIIDVLVATGDRLKRDPDGFVQEAMERSFATSPYPRDLVERSFSNLGLMFNRASMEFMLEQELGGKARGRRLDGGGSALGQPARIRAFPPRLVHIIAGNSPGVAANTIIRGALVKGVHLLKLPSNELFSAPAILQALAAVGAGPSR